MSTSVPENSYILGTQEGEAIPLAAARAKYSKAISLGTGVVEAIAMPEDLNLVTVYADVNFTITYIDNELPVVAGWDAGAFRGIAGIFYDLFVPKNIEIIGDSSGTIVLNCLVRWAAISNEGKYIAS